VQSAMQRRPQEWPPTLPRRQCVLCDHLESTLCAAVPIEGSLSARRACEANRDLVPAALHRPLEHGSLGVA
jgi:hypothetical protein